MDRTDKDEHDAAARRVLMQLSGVLGGRDVSTADGPVLRELLSRGWSAEAIVSGVRAQIIGDQAKIAMPVRWLISSALPELARRPAPAAAATRPPWCGVCDEQTRFIEDDDGRPRRCPDCHLLIAGLRPESA